MSEIKEDLKEVIMAFGLGAVFLIAFNKVWFLFWQFVAYLGGNI